MAADRGSELVLLDTNVFVSAIKDPAKETDTFRLLVRILRSDDVLLVGNEVLVREYLRYAEAFPSPTAAALAASLVERTQLVHVEDRFLRACAPYVPAERAADRLHAATCLQTGAALVSNDRHVRSLRAAGVVEVLTTSEAIRRWLP